MLAIWFIVNAKKISMTRIPMYIDLKPNFYARKPHKNFDRAVDKKP